MRFAIKKGVWLVTLLLTAWGGGGCPIVVAEELEGTIGQQVEKFEYRMDDRDDPFFPFLSKESAVDTPDEVIIDDDDVLTGMRRFEPGQLKLVGVMATPRGRIAMAEDIAGQGYTLSEGMLIGRNGKITRIDNGQVFITETAKTRAGRTINSEIVMQLKKDSGNNQ